MIRNRFSNLSTDLREKNINTKQRARNKQNQKNFSRSIENRRCLLQRDRSEKKIDKKDESRNNIQVIIEVDESSHSRTTQQNPLTSLKSEWSIIMGQKNFWDEKKDPSCKSAKSDKKSVFYVQKKDRNNQSKNHLTINYQPHSNKTSEQSSQNSHVFVNTESSLFCGSVKCTLQNPTSNQENSSIPTYTSKETSEKSEVPSLRPAPNIPKIISKEEVHQKYKKEIEKQQRLKNRETRSMLRTWLASSDKDFNKLQEKMKNQKSLKLKDYLRLASLSNEIRFRNLSKKKQSQDDDSKSSQESSMSSNKRKIIDPHFSIILINQAIQKKLENIVNSADHFMREIECQQVVGKTYDDLVFMCNIFRVFDEKLFQSARTIRQIFVDYKRKKTLGNCENNQQFVSKMINCLTGKYKGNKNLTKRRSQLLSQNIAGELSSLLLMRK